MIQRSGTRRHRYLNQDQQSHDGNEGGVNNPGTEVAHCRPFAVWLEDRKHQDPVSSVASHSAQPEHNAHGQQRAARGNRREVVRCIKNGLDEEVSPNADDHPREVQHPNDSCGRSVVIDG